jgi:uncharacterized RmlC-like cupin family protein
LALAVGKMRKLAGVGAGQLAIASLAIGSDLAHSIHHHSHNSSAFSVLEHVSLTFYASFVDDHAAADCLGASDD